MSGEATPSQMGGILMALRVRGETINEITGAVSAMRSKMLRSKRRARGRCGRHRWRRLRLVNVSTCASFIVAGAASPSPSTATARYLLNPELPDCLAALGIKIDLPLNRSAAASTRPASASVAPSHHPAMKNVGPTRVELATRTIFNLLGPLSNPAGVRRQMVACSRGNGWNRWRRC